MGPVSKGDKVALLENGTVKADKVALRDLAFWLPYTGKYLGKVVPFAPFIIIDKHYTCTFFSMSAFDSGITGLTT